MNNHLLGRNTHSRSGFTLIELLVVVAIIGLLTSVVLASLSNAKQKTRDTARISQVREVRTALELYHSINNQYPQLPGMVGSITDLAPYLTPTHIKEITDDPVSPGGTSYGSLGTGTGYVISIFMENKPRCKVGEGTSFSSLFPGQPTCN